MNYSDVRDLQQKRAKIFEDMKALRSTAEKEKRELSAEERNKFDAMGDEVDNLKRSIDDWTRLAGYESEMRGLADGKTIISTPEKVSDEARAKDYNDAFVAFLRHGNEGVTPEQRSLLMEKRDFSSGTANTGGNTVAPEFLKKLEVALKFFGGMWANADIVRTNTGAALSLPTLNDTATVGELLAENTAATADTSTPFGTLSLPAYMYSSRLVAVSLQLMQDSAFDVSSEVARLLGERLGRITNTHFTTGDGSSKPRGVVIDATLGKTGTTGQTTSVIYDDLVDLVYSVDYAYRMGGNCKWMMNDSSIKVVRKLKDSQNRPLWEPSVQAGQPDTLMGYPVIVNNDVAAMAASAKSILFGDFSKYKICQVLDTNVARLNERLMDKLQVGFLGFLRAGGALLDAGTHPVSYYANSAT